MELPSLTLAPGINLRRKLLHRADPSLQGFQPIYQSILFHLTLVALAPCDTINIVLDLNLEVEIDLRLIYLLPSRDKTTYGKPGESLATP